MAHKLLQHEGGPDNLGFVCLALVLCHQEQVREEEQVHVQLEACRGERGRVSWSRGNGRIGIVVHGAHTHTHTHVYAETDTYTPFSDFQLF